MLPSNQLQEFYARRRGRIVTSSGAIVAWRGTYSRWLIYSPSGHFAGSCDTYSESVTYANRIPWAARAA